MQIIYIISYIFIGISSFSTKIDSPKVEKNDKDLKCNLTIKIKDDLFEVESKNCTLTKYKKEDEKTQKKEKIAPYKYFFLKNPNRFIFDIYSKNINIKILTNKTLKLKTRHSKQNFGYRFVIETNKQISITKGVSKIECKIPIDKKFNDYLEEYTTGEEDEKIVEKVNKKTSKRITIAIDPGHGGKDPGCIGGKGNIREKDLTLKYALDLRDLLLKNNFNVVMTRSSDKFVNLRKRVEIATNYKSDLFISIHADALKAKKPGSTIYIISDINMGHDDRNLFYIDSYTPRNILKNYTRMIQNLLIDIYHQDTKRKAKILSQKILDRMKTAKTCNGKCSPKERSFGVLRRVDMPSILIELGFINNEEDEKRLLSESHRKEILDNILHGIKDYLNASSNR